MFGAGSVVSALAGSLGVMIAGRAIQGAGGAIFPLAIGIIRDEFPREKVATGIGTISAMFGIGGGVGLVIAGVLVDGLGVAVDLLAQRGRGPDRRVGDLALRPRVARPRARRGSTGSAPRCCRGALATLLLGVCEGNAWGWASAGVLGLFAAAAGRSAAIWAAWEWRVRRTRSSTCASCAARPVWTTNLAAFAIGFAMFGSYVLIPQLVQTAARVTGYGFGAVDDGERAVPAARARS